MGGSFSLETGQWKLADDNELRKRVVEAVRFLFPANRSFNLLDDEMSFSLLDVDGSGLIDELAMQRLVKKVGFKMERWQLLYLLERLDMDRDGFVGFADFILFMHGQDPNEAMKRGLKGPKTINVALTNSHLRGSAAKRALASLKDYKDPEEGPEADPSLGPGSPRGGRSLGGSTYRDSQWGSPNAFEQKYMRRYRGEFVNFEPFRSVKSSSPPSRPSTPLVDDTSGSSRWSLRGSCILTTINLKRKFNCQNVSAFFFFSLKLQHFITIGSLYISFLIEITPGRGQVREGDGEQSLVDVAVL